MIPLTIFKRLGLGEARPTTVTLQLADRSLTYPRGIVEDVLVKVDKFIFSADFIVLDMEEDRDIPLILGRPFLATGRTLIDVQKGELTMRVQNEEVTFNVFKAMKFPSDFEDCFRIDLIDKVVDEAYGNTTIRDPLEDSLVNSSNVETLETMEYLNLLNYVPQFDKSKQKFEVLK